MARVKLEPLATYTYRTALTVRVTDINYGGHLANNAVAGLLHQARIDALSELGVDEMDLGDGETGLIMTDMAVNFGAEAFLKDQLNVESEFILVKTTSFRMAHMMKRGDVVVAVAEMGFAGYNYAQHKLAALPRAFAAKIKSGN